MTTTSAATAATAVRPPYDVRGFWRVLLAVIAPLPMLGMGAYYILSPSPGDASFEDTVAALAAHESRIPLLEWAQMPFLLITPAAFAVVWVTRRHTPRLTSAGALIALTGFLAGFGTVGGVVTPASLAVQHDLDVAALAELDAAQWEHPIVLLGSLLFILGITVGLLLLGVALWRSRVAPAWTGLALGLGGFTHPFMPGQVAAGIGLLVTAAGFCGASWVLLRMSNDEFDLAPVSAEDRQTDGGRRP